MVKNASVGELQYENGKPPEDVSIDNDITVDYMVGNDKDKQFIGDQTFRICVDISRHGKKSGSMRYLKK